MKFGAIYCLYDDHEYLEVSLESIQHQLDKILFLISNVPWNGGIVDNTSTVQKVKHLCEKNENFQLIEGHWTNEIDQRNFGLKCFFEENIDYCFVIDSDEIYHDYDFKNIKQFILHNPSIAAFHLEWNTYWTKQYYVISPREYYKPLIAVKVDSFKFVTVRHGVTSIQRAGKFIFESKQTKYNGILIPKQVAICFHLSYARTDEFIKRKLQTNSHAKEFLPNWYKTVWCNWKPRNINLHPVTPAQYEKAISENFMVFPVALKRFIKEERSRTQPCSIILINWNSTELLFRCLNLIKKNTVKPYELILIDNGTKNLSSTFEQDIKDLGISKVILNKENLGFAIAVNQGIQVASPNSDICLMNVDAEPQEKWLDFLYKTLIENPLAGIIGPLGNEIENGYQKENFVNKDTKIFNVHFYCVLISREVINRIGLLDTRFGLGCWEDNDYCIRAKLANYESWISAKSLVRHKAHQVFQINNLDYNKLETKNKELLQEKLIEMLYQYGAMIDLVSLSSEIAKKCGLIIKDE